MGQHFDLKAYFERIGYDGPATTTFDALRDVHRLHAQTLPFENLNPLMRWAIPLDSDSLQQKMVHNRRGGYCFEQNLLLSHALRTIGFEVTGLAARVLSNRPADSLPARTHMLLLVKGDGEHYLADAGFGGMTLTEPIKLETDTVQTTSHEQRRVRRVEDARDPQSPSDVGESAPQDGGTDDGEFLMEAGIRDEWRTLFRFSLQPQALADYEMANFYVSNRPGSHFINGLSAARPTPEDRYGLRNNELAVHDLEGNTERSTLTTVAELRDVLTDVFLLELPDSPELDDVLERLAAGETIEPGE